MTTPNNTPEPNMSGVKGRVPTPEEVARRDGYVQGRTDENYVQGNVRGQERAMARAEANDSAASGVLIGLSLAVLATLAGAAVYFLTGDRTDVAPIAVPEVIERETVRENNTETTIIERETAAPSPSVPDVQIDVPAPEVQAPDVNITNEAPAAEPAPEPEPKAVETEAAPVAEPATAE